MATAAPIKGVKEGRIGGREATGGGEGETKKEGARRTEREAINYGDKQKMRNIRREMKGWGWVGWLWGWVVVGDKRRMKGR